MLVIPRNLRSRTGGVCPSLERAECVCEAGELDFGNEPSPSIQTFFGHKACSSEGASQGSSLLLWLE